MSEKGFTRKAGGAKVSSGNMRGKTRQETIKEKLTHYGD